MQRLLAAIERNLADAAVPAISEPGHHQTLIQSLPLTLGVGSEVWVVLDALRKQRNANDYTGQPITSDLVSECLGQARALQQSLLALLASEHPQLVARAS